MTEERNVIRAFTRGLDVLVKLNQYNGLNIQELAKRTGLSRSNLYRILETLADEDYVSLTPIDSKYRLTTNIRNLTIGYKLDRSVSEVIVPLVESRACLATCMNSA